MFRRPVLIQIGVAALTAAVTAAVTTFLILKGAGPVQSRSIEEKVSETKIAPKANSLSLILPLLDLPECSAEFAKICKQKFKPARANCVVKNKAQFSPSCQAKIDEFTASSI